jgi:hypothetical protein
MPTFLRNVLPLQRWSVYRVSKVVNQTHGIGWENEIPLGQWKWQVGNGPFGGTQCFSWMGGKNGTVRWDDHFQGILVFHRRENGTIRIRIRLHFLTPFNGTEWPHPLQYAYITANFSHYTLQPWRYSSKISIGLYVVTTHETKTWTITDVKTSKLIIRSLLILKILNTMPEPILPVVSEHSYGVNIAEITKPFTMKTCPNITNQNLCPFVNCHWNKNTHVEQ